MRVIVSGRQTGKTYKIVQWCKGGEATDSYPGWSRIIITPSEGQARFLRAQYDLDYRQVFSWRSWHGAVLGARPVEVMIDNADMILQGYLGQRIVGMSMTGEVWDDAT